MPVTPSSASSFSVLATVTVTARTPASPGANPAVASVTAAQPPAQPRQVPDDPFAARAADHVSEEADAHSKLS